MVLLSNIWCETEHGRDRENWSYSWPHQCINVAIFRFAHQRRRMPLLYATTRSDSGSERARSYRVEPAPHSWHSLVVARSHERVSFHRAHRPPALEQAAMLRLPRNLGLSGPSSSSKRARFDPAVGLLNALTATTVVLTDTSDLHCTYCQRDAGEVRCPR
jgi:hypothetical protein